MNIDFANLQLQYQKYKVDIDASIQAVLNKSNFSPYSLIQPICLAGTPTISAYGSTSLLTTAPAPTKAYAPTVVPQTIVQFAPSVAPFLQKYPCIHLYVQSMSADYKH